MDGFATDGDHNEMKNTYNDWDRMGRSDDEELDEPPPRFRRNDQFDFDRDQYERPRFNGNQQQNQPRRGNWDNYDDSQYRQGDRTRDYQGMEQRGRGFENRQQMDRGYDQPPRREDVLYRPPQGQDRRLVEEDNGFRRCGQNQEEDRRNVLYRPPHQGPDRRREVGDPREQGRGRDFDEPHREEAPYRHQEQDQNRRQWEWNRQEDCQGNRGHGPVQDVRFRQEMNRRGDDYDRDQGGYDRRPQSQNQYQRQLPVQERRGGDYITYERSQPDDRRPQNYNERQRRISGGGDMENYGGQQQFHNRDRHYSQGDQGRFQGNGQYQGQNYQGGNQQYQTPRGNYENQNYYGNDRQDHQEQNYQGKQNRLEPWAPRKENIDLIAMMERKRSETVDPSLDYSVNVRLNEIQPMEPFTRFSQFADASTVENACRIVGFKELRPLQKVACPYVLAGYDIFLRTACGSGKTVTYMFPLIKKVIEEKRRAPRGNNSPYVLIIAPSLELVKHTYEVARVYCAGTTVSTGMIVGNVDWKKPNACDMDVDILVGTSQKLHDLLLKREICLRACLAIVVEEADWFWAESLYSMLEIAKRTETNNRAQRILTSATFNEQFSLNQVFDGSRTAVFENKEELSYTKHKFVRVGDSTIFQHLLQEIQKGKEGDFYRCVVVATTGVMVEKVMRFFKENELPAKEYSTVSAIMQIAQRELLLNQFSDMKFKIIVTSDNALLRGIRLPQVEKIIHLEAPQKTQNTKQLLVPFKHRLGPIGFSSVGESVLLANVTGDRQENLLELLTSIVKSTVNSPSTMATECPDWLHRLAATERWNDDDKKAAEQPPVQEEQKEVVENYGNDSAHHRAYNYNYKRFHKPYNNHNYTYYDRGHSYPSYMPSQFISPAAIQGAFCPAPLVLNPSTLTISSGSSQNLTLVSTSSQNVNDQIATMYAGGALEQVPLFAPNQQVMYSGATTFYPPEKPKEPVAAPVPGPGERVYSNNDGYQYTCKDEPVPAPSSTEKKENTMDESSDEESALPTLPAPEVALVRNPSPQEFYVEEQEQKPLDTRSSSVQSPETEADSSVVVSPDREESYLVDQEQEPLEPRSSSVLTGCETDCEEPPHVAAATPSESLTSSFEKLMVEDATVEETASASSTQSL